MRLDVRDTLARKVYYGWVITIACFLATVAVFGSSYSFGVFYGSFLESFDASRSQIALVFGTQTALLYVVGVGVARVIERRGQRLVAGLSSVVLVLGLVWAAVARSYLELLLSLGVVTAVGMAGLYIVGWATLPLWFERRRGTAVSIAASGTGVSLVVVPTILEAVLGAAGWRAAMLVLAGLSALLLSIAVYLFADSPQEIGADPSIEFRNTATTDEQLDRRAIRSIVFSTPFVLVLGGWLLIYTPLYVILSHIVLFTGDSGIGRSVGVLALTAIGVTTAVARVGAGPLSDRVGRLPTFVAFSALLGAATIGLGVSTTGAFVLAAALAIGAGYGGAGGLIGAVTADLFGNRSLNVLFAILSLSFAVSGLLAPPLAGLWFEYTGSYETVFVVSGMVGIAGAGCVTLATRRRGTNG